MLARRLSFLLALALLGSLLALAPAGADPLSSEVDLTQTTAPTAPSVAPLAAKAPLQCTKQAPLAHDEELAELKLKGKARWCGGQVRDDGVGGPNNGILASFDGAAALDVDVTLPRRGSGPFPLIVMLHGLGGSRESYWREPAHYAARGFAVLDYTARGYHGTDAICLDEDTPSATVKDVPPEVYEGYGPSLACRTQLASRRYEVKDAQYLASRLVDGSLVSGVTAKPGIGVFGQSYGGGQTWMLTRDNRWKSPAGKRVRVKAAVPVIGWSDLLDALVPNGRAGDTKFLKNRTDERLNERLAEPVGVAKESYISTFFAGIQLASGGSLPGYLTAWRDALFAGEPYDATTPAVMEAADKLLSERSALYMPKDKGNPAILAVQGFTDVVFPATQSLNMYNLLNKNRKTPYPMNIYFGDFGHPIAQNKSDEAAYVNKLVGRWFDHYLRGKGDAPKRRVEARTTRCDDSGLPGARFKANTWSGLQSRDEQLLEFDAAGTLDTAVDDPRSLEIKPIDIDQGTVDYSRCRVTEEPVAEGNLGVATTPLQAPMTMLGLPTVSLTADPAAPDMYVSARLWDVAENGAHTLVDRGVFRLLSADPQTALFKLFGNAYTFAEGHTIELELTANDTRSFLASNAEGTIEVSAITLSLPLAKPGAAVVGSQQ
ncbi:MAG: CocE/NonD family hydrolase C-terminal non-catalytic domain-containing protein [Actinomycetota bacterium]